MTDFVVTITDPASLTGITWAREQHNASLSPPPLELDEEGNPIGDTNTLTLETDQDYVQWVMENAAISYADQKLRSEYQQHYENEVEAAKMSRQAQSGGVQNA